MSEELDRRSRRTWFPYSLGRLAWCSAGAAAGIGLTLWCTGAMTSPIMLASLGGSTVFLFSLTRSPAAQPRALIGGHLGSSLIGILCAQAFGHALWVYALALVLAIAFMLATRTVHPPAGANPLIMIHQHADFTALGQPVAVGLLVLIVTAAIWSRLLPGTIRYPYSWFAKSPDSDHWGPWK